MEVVLPPQSSTDQLVLNTLKTGEDAMARVKGSHYETVTEGGEYGGSLYHLDRPSAIISLDPMLSRAQALLSSEPTTYTGYQGLYPGHTTNTVSPLLSQTAPSPSPSQENLQL